MRCDLQSWCRKTPLFIGRNFRHWRMSELGSNLLNRVRWTVGNRRHLFLRHFFADFVRGKCFSLFLVKLMSFQKPSQRCKNCLSDPGGRVAVILEVIFPLTTLAQQDFGLAHLVQDMPGFLFHSSTHFALWRRRGHWPSSAKGCRSGKRSTLT